MENQSKFQVYTNRLGPTDTAWPAATAMETDDVAGESSSSSVNTTDPIAQTDPAGNVTLIWRKETGTRFDLWSRRWTGGSWGTAVLIETHDTNDVEYPALAVGAGGTAVAAWDYDGTYDVWANVLR